MKHKPKESTCIRQNFALAILLSFPFWKRVVALPSYTQYILFYQFYVQTPQSHLASHS